MENLSSWGEFKRVFYSGSFTQYNVCNSVINDELYRYRCQLSMDSDILRDENKLAYKYVVYNSMEEKEENRYEFLYGVPESKTRPINRCLIVPTAEFQSGN